MNTPQFANPYRPGAGHTPPHMAGRVEEEESFRKLLDQSTILENYILTGLRGVGKTVLLERLKPVAQQKGWRWIGADLSESASISEDSLATRILADLSVITSGITISEKEHVPVGFESSVVTKGATADFPTLINIYKETPGLSVDKLKAVLEFAWAILPKGDSGKGLIFAYDEAQNLADHAEKEQFPVSLLLDTFQSIQRKGIPFMLVMAGLPTLFPKLVDSRTFAERMFHVVFLDSLNEEESREAILEPLNQHGCPVRFSEKAVNLVVEKSGGYPYFIQFICREAYDVWTVTPDANIPLDGIISKLDTDFFAGRWARATDRQRELLSVIASLSNSDGEFTVAEIVEKSKQVLTKPFTSSHINQMLVSLGVAGLIYKNRHGKYSFAVPLLGGFIQRQELN